MSRQENAVSAKPSEEALNAFVDGELRGGEHEALMSALCRDLEIRSRVAEVHVVQALVRHAYQPATPPASADRSAQGARPSGRRRAAVLTAIATPLALAMLAAWIVGGFDGG